MDEQQNAQPVAPQPAAPQPAPATPPATPPAGHQQNTGMAIVAYILFFIPLLTDSKNDPFVKFHVKQGAVVFALALALWIVRAVLPWWWLWRFYWLFNLVGLAILVFAIIGIVNAANGKQEKLPLIGQFGDKMKFIK